MDFKEFLKAKADKNMDGKVDIADFNFAVDMLHASKHLVALYGFAVGVVATLLILHLFGK